MEVDDVGPSRKLQRFSGENGDGENLAGMSNNNRIRDWNPSSRIIRVSRASGGKDRHSKVLTSKGLRDRRIRLSVSTAIQFYDLQDRLGLDQPSKAVEWLLNAASDSISDLPSINPNSSNNGGIRDFNNNNNGGFRDLDTNLDNNFDNNQNQTLSLSKSGGSSASETSKNSSAAAGLSLSRTEIRGKARERARERTAKEREKDHNLEPQQSSFTQLLTGGLSGSGSSGHQTGSTRQWNGTDYFNQVQLIPSLPHFPPFTISSDQNRQEQQQMNHQFSFVPDATDYNTLNFGISSSTSCSSSPGGRSAIGGYNRGTLQSNSQSFLLNNNIHQRSSSSSSSSSPMDSQSISFFMAAPPPPVLDHHSHNLHAGFDGRLFLYGNRSSDNKDKERR